MNTITQYRDRARIKPVKTSEPLDIPMQLHCWLPYLQDQTCHYYEQQKEHTKQPEGRHDDVRE